MEAGPEALNIINPILEKFFKIEDYAVDRTRGVLNYKISTEADAKEKIKQMTKELEKAGFLPVVRQFQDIETNIIADNIFYVVVGRTPKLMKTDIRINIVLFLATIFTVCWTGFLFAINPYYVDIYQVSNPLPTVLMFLAAIFSVVGIHELGHLVACKRHGIASTLPYFIPLPPIFDVLTIFGGTMGAVIKQRSPTLNRDQLFDVGFAGPFFGFLASTLVTIIGYRLSISLPLTLQQFQELYPGTGVLPTPLLFDIIGLIFASDMAGIIFVHPVAYAGWLGMFITSLNLFPASQLDGGHVFRSVLGRKWHRYVTYISIGILVILGFYMMALFIIIFAGGRDHPGALDDVSPVSRNRKFLALLVIPLVILCMPRF